MKGRGEGREEERQNSTAIQLDLSVQGRDPGNWSAYKFGMPGASEILKGTLTSGRENYEKD